MIAVSILNAAITSVLVRKSRNRSLLYIIYTICKWDENTVRPTIIEIALHTMILIIVNDFFANFRRHRASYTTTDDYGERHRTLDVTCVPPTRYAHTAKPEFNHPFKSLHERIIINNTCLVYTQTLYGLRTLI